MAAISITPSDKRIRVLWRGKVVADSTHVLDLKEGGSITRYIPRADLDMTKFEKTTHHTRCPYKGEASYFTLHDTAARDENAVWTYESPINDAAAIKDHVAFYPNKVTIEVVQA